MRFYGGFDDEGRLAVPAAVRAALDLAPGDLVGFELDGVRVAVAKVTTVDHLDALAGTLPEWASDADAEAYDGL